MPRSIKGDIILLRSQLSDCCTKDQVETLGPEQVRKNFRNILYSFLHCMPVGSEFEIDAVFGPKQPRTRTILVEEVKRYIDGFNFLIKPDFVEFNHDYSKVSKK